MHFLACYCFVCLSQSTPYARFQCLQKKTHTQKAPAPKNFEKALEKAEKLTESMEAGEMPLAEAVSSFEQASRLIDFCQSELDKAELKIEKISKDRKSLEAFESETNES